MPDILSLALAALLGAALPLALWGGELALARFLPARWQVRQHARMRGWLLLAAIWAVCSVALFGWSGYVRAHGALALQVTFAAWAIGGAALMVKAHWLVYRKEWIRLHGGRPLNALGRLVMLLLLEALAATILTEDLRYWLPTSPATPVLQAAGSLAGDVLLVVFIGLLLLAMFDLLSERMPSEP